MKFVPRVKSGLRSHKLDDQLLVYDAEVDRVHLLDSTTAQVLRSLQGEEIAASASAVDTESDAYLLAIDELAKAELIDTPSAPIVEVTRREMLRRTAALGAGAFAIPTIVSLTPSTSSAQTACDNRLNDGNNHCNNGSFVPCCATDANGIPLVCKPTNSKCVHTTGFACGANGDCLSGKCTSGVCD